MSLFDRIDAWTFKPVDAFVLWAWNELGIEWRTIFGGALGMSYMALLAAASEMGSRYGLQFWLIACVGGAAAIWVLRRYYRLSAAALGAANLHFRSAPFGRFARVIWVTFAISDFPFSAPRCTVDLVQLACIVILYANLPTKPRNKKRREVLFGKLAPARS